EDYMATHGYAPTLEEIGAHFGLSSLATVHKHLSNLERKGIIARKWSLSRAIELALPQKTAQAVELPLLGRVAAGTPIEVVETEDTLAACAVFVRHRRRAFGLGVGGGAMVAGCVCGGD